MKSHHFLAVDLGAESGRTMVASLTQGSLALSETYRFANQPVNLPGGGLHWDILRLWSEIKTGIGISSSKFDHQIDSIGLDAWGVDFALLDQHNSLLSNPFHYRDNRTDGMLEKAFERMPRAEIFAKTGVQFLRINTLYQLLAMSLQGSPILAAARSFVTIPDLFNYWLSGELTLEFTNATTTQCFNPSTREWAAEVLNAMQIPTALFRPVTEPGTRIGPLRDALAAETGACKAQVVVPACHDTGSALVAVPAQSENFAWISSGTWSILGAEVREPCLTGKAMDYNFTNEGGVCGTWRLSKNITGLWLVQECRRAWERQGEVLSYVEITRLAAGSRPFLAVIDPDDDRFLNPRDMVEQIRGYCAETGQPVPQTKGEVIRVALESIALKYRWVLERLEELANQHFAPVHIIGGGVKNTLLNQFTANATNRVVIAGPVEATAIGNVLMQAIGMNDLGSLEEAREVARRSFEPEIYEPQQAAAWDESYIRFQRLIK